MAVWIGKSAAHPGETAGFYFFFCHLQTSLSCSNVQFVWPGVVQVSAQLLEFLNIGHLIYTAETPIGCTAQLIPNRQEHSERPANCPQDGPIHDYSFDI